MFGIGLPELIVILVITIVLVVPYWKIFSKAGFSGWLSLTLLIPFVNLLVPYYLAFSKWPIHKEIDKLKKQLG